jgi:hypothetical protein
MYDDCEATPILRFAHPGHRLQQLWRKPTWSPFGNLCGWETEWRDVPVELVEYSAQAEIERLRAENEQLKKQLSDNTPVMGPVFI